jgi:hypothetical protein
MAFLPTKAFDFGQGHTLDAELGKGVTYVIELEGLDDCSQ